MNSSISNIYRLLDARQSLVDYCQSDELSEDGLCKRIRQFFEIEDTTRILSASAGRLLLHHACMNEKVTFGTISLILSTFPCAAGCADEEEFQPVPLHLACWNGSTTLDIVRLLIDEFPESVHRQSVDGGMPLHYLCCGGCDDVNILELLLEKYPKALYHSNEAGMLPIQIACLRSKSIEFYRILTGAYSSLSV